LKNAPNRNGAEATAGRLRLWVLESRAPRKDEYMTTNAAPDLLTRLQRWLSEAGTAWKHDDKWLRESIHQAADLLIASKDELATCRAEQARLQEARNMKTDADELHTGDDARIDCVTGIRAAVEELLEDDDFPLNNQQTENLTSVLADCDRLDALLIRERAQVSTLTAALRQATQALGWLVNERWGRPFSDFARAKEIMNECAAVLRAASEGAP
jgi:hypothetical protein